MLSKKCECFYLTELNMEINVISKKYIRVCVKHSNKIFAETSERKEYRFCKKKKIYYLKDLSGIDSDTIELDLNRDKYKFSLQSKDSVESLESNETSTTSSSLDKLLKVDSFDSIIDFHISKYHPDCNHGENYNTISFGKYKGLTFNELLKKDKKYSINIMHIESKSKDIPNNMKEFSNFVKSYIKKN